MAGATSYVVDSTGHVVVASDDTTIGATLPDAALAAAASKVNRGVVGRNHFVATAVAGSSWRTVVVTSRSALLAPYDQTARSAWLIFEAAIGQWRRNGAASDASGVRVAALFLDLDGFKPVNDTYGDALLKAVEQRLVAATRPEDFVSRFGGDEFLVLCRGLQTEDDARIERFTPDVTPV